jgi:cytochrome c oxidase subunit 1
VLSSAGASILAAGYILPLLYLMWSLKWGKKAGPNPWNAKGLEWTIPSPPITHNFEKIPVVTEGAYAYGPPPKVVGPGDESPPPHFEEPIRDH